MKLIIKFTKVCIGRIVALWRSINNLYIGNYWVDKLAEHGKHIYTGTNLSIRPENIFMEDYTRLQNRVLMISNVGKLRIRKYSAVGADCLIIPENHIPTVGVPQYLSFLHINDIVNEIVIEEDVWVGARTILLSKCHIARGAIVGAGSLVTKPIPPYAIVVGSPAKIVGVKFSIEQILRHEEILYPLEERMKREELEKLFEIYYCNKPILGTSNMTNEDKCKLTKMMKNINMKDYSF